ncbi:3-oxoacyl-[acyl-carrier protein] reductase [Candidatus Paraburkholderia kirkii UZHbot1]|uniref:3-oxoacyl-[acyl-carrier protein] reductase n=1 Tax=Candidatus Paraburkholderia kirkii UZHbot1 TaxID=1055526 RepID=G4MDF8_9BURK|nr:3-oxoacyl-[acyl-carrier protein] reductase [Candidatus Paraburkholderia kirkii UZHbot1]
MRLQGKTVIVTGGGSGFGEGIAKTFAREGANVVVNDLNVNGPAAERVASEIALASSPKAAHGRAIAVQGDVTKREDWQKLHDAAIQDFGSVQIVVNNAGTTHRNKPVLEVTEAEFDRVYAVNVKSIYWSVEQFVLYFREQGGGAFINIASTAGVRPRPGLVWYNASKAAVIIASKALAVELGTDRIRVNCINPVMSETALLSEFMGMEDIGYAREPPQVPRDDSARKILDAAGRRQRRALLRLRRCRVHHRRRARRGRQTVCLNYRLARHAMGAARVLHRGFP